MYFILNQMFLIKKIFLVKEEKYCGWGCGFL